MLNQYVRYAPRPKFDSMISEFVALLQRYGLRLDRQFMLAIKAVVQSEAVVAALGGHDRFRALRHGTDQIARAGRRDHPEKVLDTRQATDNPGWQGAAAPRPQPAGRHRVVDRSVHGRARSSCTWIPRI